MLQDLTSRCSTNKQVCANSSKSLAREVSVCTEASDTGGTSPDTKMPEDDDFTGNEVANLTIQVPNHSCNKYVFVNLKK